VPGTFLPLIYFVLGSIVMLVFAMQRGLLPPYSRRWQTYLFLGGWCAYVALAVCLMVIGGTPLTTVFLLVFVVVLQAALMFWTSYFGSRWPS
jgi:hypothetical protein